MKIDAFRGDNFFLSNFYSRESLITFDGIAYTNTEATFQAQKCINKADRIRFSTLNPSEAKKLGRQVTLRKDWESVKIGLMKDIVTQKFIQNKDLLKRLLNTKELYLEEGNTWGDRVWGTVNGKGTNNLGIILMEVREELKKLDATKNIEVITDYYDR